MAGMEDEDLKEAMRKFARSEEDKNRHKTRFDDCYEFALPWRHRLSTDTHTTPDDADDLTDDTAMVAVTDFASDMLATFTPRYVDWMDVAPMAPLGQEVPGDVQELLQDYKETIFHEMARSNFYEAAEECYLDLACGTMGMVIEDRGSDMPIHCECVPSTDLWVLKGPFSSLQGRWRRRLYEAEEIPVLWPDATIPEGQRLQTRGSSKLVEVTDGFMRVWSDKANETWRYLVWSGKKLLLKRDYVGAGSLPLIVGRWLTDPVTSWGVGPLNQVLSSVRMLNDVQSMMLEQMEFAVSPPFVYDDDGVINVSGGLEPGHGVARMPGSKVEGLQLYTQYDVGYFELDRLRQNVRRALFQDAPDQAGKTPPTATQWLDEAAKTARRMGSPAGRLIVEWQYPIFQRFAFLLAERGRLPKVRLNGKDISITPVSPLMTSLRQEEMMRYTRYAEVIAQLFGPEILRIVVNPLKFAAKLGDTLAIDLSVNNSDQEISQALQQMMSIGQQAGVLPNGAGPGAAGGAPPQ